MFRKKEGVILQLDVFGEVIGVNKEFVTVKVGSLIYEVKPEKLRKVVGGTEVKNGK